MQTALDTTTESSETTARIGPETIGERSGRAWLATPLLRFPAVEPGFSLAMPIVVQGLEDGAAIDVVAPPLAPFSVIARPSGVITHRQQTDDDHPAAELWIRYDATTPMAVDHGQITIGHAPSGRRWTVDLDGSGILAKPRF